MFPSTDHWKTSYYVISVKFSRLIRYKGIGKMVAYMSVKYFWNLHHRQRTQTKR